MPKKKKGKLKTEGVAVTDTGDGAPETRKQCPKCGYFNPKEASHCELCESGLDGEEEKSGLEQQLWDLNKELLAAITEENETAIEATRVWIADLVKLSKGQFVQDEEGYACAVDKPKETGGPSAPSPQLPKKPQPKEKTKEEAMEKKTVTLLFSKERETKNTVRFGEVEMPGQAPIVGTLYVQKWWIESASKVTVTIDKE